MTHSATGLELLQQLNDYPHAKLLNLEQEEVLDYEVGLGAIQKIGGAWRFKDSERFNGQLSSYTWQIVDGFTSIEVLGELVSAAQQLEGAQLLFACDGRACGRGVQWANRVFHQPLLYGREGLQRYRVYSLGSDPRSLLILFAASRTADRQYLHAELLEVTP
ncbi:MAG: DUF4892 domain-containing protein [Halieaceae bacterium]|nr:DUF4892 domain-containing protein [Halieaceae bacterium]